MISPATRLLTWYKRHGRDLPWRKTRDPYSILVSEIMLQQTQVARVLFFYDRWLKQFPTWDALAKAQNAEVVHAWAGLGYNRRGLMLRDIARQVVERGVPQTEETWRELKGIGPYTAAALTAFSLKQRALPIDTNIRRTLGRILLGIPFPQPSDDISIRTHQDEILPTRGAYYDVPQALFDLATMICTKSPACITCPMQGICKAAPKFLSGNLEVPKQMVKKAKEKKHRNKPYPDRIYRGRILKLVREQTKGISLKNVGPKIDPDFTASLDEKWVEDMIERLIKDGFLRKQKTTLFLA